ncbi:MAG: hypothetical protein M5R36_18770 [Deltaproteobacteria bacterium]|nr:hypothetical protein [Deltaproteobacteria bacterium]
MKTKIFTAAFLVLATSLFLACGGTDDDGDSNESDDDDTADDDDTTFTALDDDVADDDSDPGDPGFYQFAPPPSDDIGVFVATIGDDANPGTSVAAPKRTFDAGLVLAAVENKSVFVAEGDYRWTKPARASVYGGYESDHWNRDIDADATVLVIPEGEEGVILGRLSVDQR